MNLSLTVPVITIDGPAGTGKGTICHALAHHLGWHCLDSGAIYRVFALAAQESGLQLENIQGLCELAKNLALYFSLDANSSHRVLLHEHDVTEAIRSEACGQLASQFAAIPEIRQALLERQRQFAMLPGLVTDGRDMGTVVFPHAFLKIYLNASRDERAKRRLLQLHNKGIDVSLAQVVEELTARDLRDSQREVSPMQPAADAVIVDTTHKSIDEVLDEILNLVNSRLKY
jgi:cytidylate kinase